MSSADGIELENQKDPKSCPSGYICNNTHQASCDAIRKNAFSNFGFGDIHAGVWCPEGPLQYHNCPVGSYCPNSTTNLSCPEGMFCPHKTLSPMIKCNRCGANATNMARDLYGFFLLIVLVVGVSVFLVSFLLKKSLKAISEQWEAAARKKLGPNDIKRREREQDRQMIRLRPKLEIIQRRLYYPDEEEKVEESYFHDHHRRLPGMDEEEGIISSEGYAERLIALPAGRVGIRFNKGISPPEIAGTKPTCKVARKVHVGDIVTALILPNGTVVEDFTPNELLDHLARHVSSEGRKLIVLRYDKKHNQAARRSQTAGHKNEQPEGPRSGGYNGSIAAAGMQISQENITFDAERFFDTLDVNGDGVLSYEELNRILRLRPSELHDFIRRMNILDDERDEHHVTKDTFVLYFLDVLDETSNFRLTEGEAGARWDEIADLFGTNSNEEIKLDNIYGSSISAFLSDVQINDLIQKMKKAKLASGSSGRSRKLITDKSRYQIFGGPQATEYVGRSLFTTHYPRILNEILIQAAQGPDPRKQRGIDIAFKDLRLLVKGRNAVLDKVTGRLHKGAMTAILGGSGAGKTSLLNALCGRAYYGEVTGDIFINGSKAAMEDLNTVGFVPQDDIVYAELTVRENLVFSGRFRLPRGTPSYEIEELADSVLSSLGLAPKARSIVGDVTRRGVSGGEKKRVNIGLELMARPTALFVDEPTSGLDASSALLVMQSLQQLVSREGVTVCSVIHQPRKFIFDLFDSLILLGTGGRMVFHGPVSTCMDYFLDLGYVLPPGESTADWLIDISTGRIAVDQRCEDSSPLEEQTIASGLRLAYRIERINGEGEHATGPPVPHPLAHKPSFGMPARASVNQRKIPPPRPPRKKRSSLSVAMLNNNGASFHRAREPILRDKHSFTRDGPSSRKRMKVDNEAKLRREMLYRNWDSHYGALDRKRKKIFEPPQPFPHPPLITRPSFLRQLHLQLQRMFLLAWRNRTTKLIDITIIIGAIALITLFEGTTLPTKEKDPPIPFDILIAPKKAQLEYGLFFPYLFGFATEGSKTFVRYGLSVGVIGAVLIGLTAVKSLTDKRQEFFREAGSGYSINAYFLAINIFTSIDQGCQVMLAAVVAEWLRHSIADSGAFYVSFIILAWVSVSWCLLIPLVVPPKNVVLVVGFFMAFFGLLFSGSNPPVEYSDIYSGRAIALLSAFFAPPRFFTETLTVSDQKCLPSQTGFTIDKENATDYESINDSFNQTQLGQLDPNLTNHSCGGWYWGVLPAVLVGVTIRFVAFGVIHIVNRGQLAKRSFWHQLRYKGNKGLYLTLALYVLGLINLLGVTSWAILAKRT